MAADLSFPRYFWGYPGVDPHPPEWSIVHLMQQHVLDAQVAALFWSLIARRAPVISVGGFERHVGKTTLLLALTAFAPPDTEFVVARGAREDFAFTAEAAPERTYVMVGEFSDHTPGYVWGEAAAKIVRLTEQGYSFAGTMHARSMDEVIAQFGRPPVSLHPSALARAHPLVVMQSLNEAPSGAQRRVSSASWLQPAPRAPGGLGAKSLVAWDARDDSWNRFASPETWEDLAGWGGATAAALRDEVADREQFLHDLTARGVAEFGAVRRAVLDYAASRGVG